MAGRTPAAGTDGRYPGLTYLVGNEQNGFQPEPPASPVDVVYLCSPNNPTGTVATRKQLENWVAWARKNDSVILFDAAYESYISDPSLPRSIPDRWRATVRSSCAASRSARASPACAARSWSCRRP
jgi:LL-diaminopimelate aminotransferase